MDSLTITLPDDWHLHLRDGDTMASVLPHTAERFGRAIVMPNLSPPVTTVQRADAYRRRILDALPDDAAFEPLMTLYLTDTTSPREIVRAKETGFVQAVKYYPAGATTNSQSGVTAIEKTYPVLEAMAAAELPLLVHGEVTDENVDVFDRERVFLERVLTPLADRFRGLRIVVEHITTRDAVEFVLEARSGIAATITPHHLLMNRNALFADGFRPHHFCFPVLKKEPHRRALVEAIAGGSRRFFLGTDSAPHARARKESACGCAGIYSAHAGIELYADVFEAVGALDRLEAFASFNGPAFYGLQRNRAKLTLIRESWRPPEAYALGSEQVVPFKAGEPVAWRLAKYRS